MNTASLYTLVTPPGEGAIATFLLDGDEISRQMPSIFRSKRSLSFKAVGSLILGHIVDAKDRVIDEAIAAPIPATLSETGHDQLELSCHGGIGTKEAVVEVLKEAGFCEARPWEMERRGYEAGKVSLPEIEARMRLGDAETARQTELLLTQRVFQERWERLGMEAALGARKGASGWREKLLQHAKDALVEYDAATRLLKTHAVTIAGPANAGKSTMNNALLRASASIVSEVPGTTRDRLERSAMLHGLALRLTDSAGIMDPVDAKAGNNMDQEAQRRAMDAAREAELVLIVLDGSRAPSEAELEVASQLSQRPHLLILNKADRQTHPEAEGVSFSLGTEGLKISALTGLNIKHLENEIEDRLLHGKAPSPGAPFTARHHHHIVALCSDIENGAESSAIIAHIRRLVGTQPNEDEWMRVMRDGEEYRREKDLEG